MHRSKIICIFTVELVVSHFAVFKNRAAGKHMLIFRLQILLSAFAFGLEKEGEIFAKSLTVLYS